MISFSQAMAGNYHPRRVQPLPSMACKHPIFLARVFMLASRRHTEGGYPEARQSAAHGNGRSGSPGTYLSDL